MLYDIHIMTKIKNISLMTDIPHNESDKVGWSFTENEDFRLH